MCTHTNTRMHEYIDVSIYEHLEAKDRQANLPFERLHRIHIQIYVCTHKININMHIYISKYVCTHKININMICVYT